MQPAFVLDKQETLPELHAQAAQAERNANLFELNEGFKDGDEEALYVFTGLVCRQLFINAKISFFKTGNPPRAEYIFFYESTLAFMRAFQYPLIKEMQQCLQEMWVYGGVVVHEHEGVAEKSGVTASFSIRHS